MIHSATVKGKIYKRARQTGIRRKLRDSMDPVRFRFPRGEVRRKVKGVIKARPLLNHPIRWYLDGHLESRPVNGIYALGQFAEYLLAYARTGCRGQSGSIVVATSFFAATRRAMESVLRGTKAGARITGKSRDYYASRVRKLTADAVATYETMYGPGSVKSRLTPRAEL